MNQIRSVKVSRGARNIPKAFEIFTGDQTLILKPKDGNKAEEWVQCLSIVLAHSQVSGSLKGSAIKKYCRLCRYLAPVFISECRIQTLHSKIFFKCPCKGLFKYYV